MFARFRSTFAAKKEWKFSVTFSLLAQLCCNQSDMLYHRLSVVLLSKVIIWKFPTSWRQIILWKAKWNFLGQKFLTTELSLKDIELGLNSPMESFPFINLQSVAGWEYTCLRKDRIILSTEPGFPRCMQYDTDLFGTRL